MLGRYAVGLVLTVVAVNVLALLGVLAQVLARLAWETARPDPFRAFRTQASQPRGGWTQVVVNCLLAVALAAYTMAFAALAEVDGASIYWALGFVALLVAQATNIRTKTAQAMQGGEVSGAAAAALPWAIIGAPAAWVCFLVVGMVFSYGEAGGLDVVGGVLTRSALALGDWLLLRVAAFALLLLFGLNLLTLAPLLVVGVGRLIHRRAG